MKKKIPKCFWRTNTGICMYGLESNGVPCKGPCPWYVKTNGGVSKYYRPMIDYPDNTDGMSFTEGMNNYD
jgi:hypothetical protein